jgi:hypothetical protein
VIDAAQMISAVEVGVRELRDRPDEEVDRNLRRMVVATGEGHAVVEAVERVRRLLREDTAPRPAHLPEDPYEQACLQAHAELIAAAEGGDEDAYRAALGRLRRIESASLDFLLARKPRPQRLDIAAARQRSKEIDELLRNVGSPGDDDAGGHDD